MKLLETVFYLAHTEVMDEALRLHSYGFESRLRGLVMRQSPAVK
jgi:hypothetical protein